jgi:outer membrane protein W
VYSDNSSFVSPIVLFVMLFYLFFMQENYFKPFWGEGINCAILLGIRGLYSFGDHGSAGFH